MLLFVNAAVSEDVPMVLSARSPLDQTVSILIGDELVTLDFFDVRSLERLRDLADDGARRLRAAIEDTPGSAVAG